MKVTGVRHKPYEIAVERPSARVTMPFGRRRGAGLYAVGKYEPDELAD